MQQPRFSMMIACIPVWRDDRGMHMAFTWSAEALRQEIREFFHAELPEAWGMTQFWDPDDDAQFALVNSCTKTLGKKNLLAVSWPKEYGGLAWPFRR